MQPSEAPFEGRQGLFLDSIIVIAVALFASLNLGVGAFLGPTGSNWTLTPILVLLSIALLIRLQCVVLEARSWFFLIFMVALVSIGAISSTFSPYGIEKMQTFLIFIILVFCCSSLQYPLIAIRTYLAILCCLSLVATVSVLAFGIESLSGRVSLDGTNPVGLARLTGLISVVAVTLLLTRRENKLPTSFLLGISAVLGVLGIIATGSRGPLLAFALALICVGVVAIGGKRVNSVALLAVVIATVTITAFLSQIGFGQISRIFDEDDSGRFLLFSSAADLAGEVPTGLGWGGFSEYAWQWSSEVGGRLYPHNLVLEFWVEGGLVALVCIVGLLTFTLVQAIRLQVSDEFGYTGAALLAIYVYSLVNAQFSSDIVGNRLLWSTTALILGISTLLARRRRKNIPLQGTVVDFEPKTIANNISSRNQS
ncbi:MAG: O-antigen ligase family protein [Candidatus Nanopelagicales bacterium]